MKRGNGVLLHISSLPGKYGIGSLGRPAYEWIDSLKAAGQSYWQILPCAPTGYGDSPYQGLSAFAGNPCFIDPDLLIEDGLLSEKDVAAALFSADAEQVDYERQFQFRRGIFKTAYQRGIRKYWEAFRAYQYQNAHWLFDYALFMAFREHFAFRHFQQWDAAVAAREQGAVMRLSEQCAEEIECAQFVQFLYDRQWRALKAYANQNGVQIIGDIPIYVSPDSVEAWAQPELFLQDGSMAGTPPDCFCEQGQLWGNPLYDWDNMKKRGFLWWVARMAHCLAHYDVVRLDHFRGLEAYFAIPANGTPKEGRWVEGPGRALIDALKAQLGELPIIAEDLGFLTPEVHELLAYCGFAGTKVLQFAFDDDDSIYLPHAYPRNCVCYTGTHDNDTTKGWFATAGSQKKRRVRDYIGAVTTANITDKLIRLAMMSVADICVIPMQDILNLGGEARMNYPSKALGNWKWRMKQGAFTPERQNELKTLTTVYGR